MRSRMTIKLQGSPSSSRVRLIGQPERRVFLIAVAASASKSTTCIMQQVLYIETSCIMQAARRHSGEVETRPVEELNGGSEIPPAWGPRGEIHHDYQRH